MSGFENSGIARRIIDTNIIIRYLVGDGGDRAERATRLFLAAEAGQVILIIPEIVLVEVVHVLSKIYKLEKTVIANTIRKLLKLSGIKTITPLVVVIKGLENFEMVNVPWPDALIVAYAQHLGLPEIYSFDGHFDKFENIVKIEPN